MRGARKREKIDKSQPWSAQVIKHAELGDLTVSVGVATEHIIN
jgi:hypothetical protein